MAEALQVGGWSALGLRNAQAGKLENAYACLHANRGAKDASKDLCLAKLWSEV